jgi:DNA-binding NarL/FixJ family response regulator
MPNPGLAAPIRVVIADDDQLYLSSLRELIDRQPELAVVGAAKDGLEAIELVESLTPEAAVIDLHMPRLDGVQALERLRRQHPNLCLIALTGDPEPELGRAATRAGADGVFLKGELVENLIERLASLSDGDGTAPR